MLEKKYVMTDADVSGYNMTAAQLGNYEYSLETALFCGFFRRKMDQHRAEIVHIAAFFRGHDVQRLCVIVDLCYAERATVISFSLLKQKEEDFPP